MVEDCEEKNIHTLKKYHQVCVKIVKLNIDVCKTKIIIHIS